VDRWSRIERIYPGFEQINTFWLRYYRRRGNLAAADRFRDMALERNRSYTGYELDKIEQAIDLGDFETAMDYYRKELQKEPDNYSHLSKIAEIHEKREQYPEAISTMEELIRIYPEDQYYIRRLGRLYHEWGRKEKAMEYYKKALDLEPAESGLRRYISYLTTGGDDCFWEDYAYDWTRSRRMIDNAPEAKEFKGASAAFLLREVIVRYNKDGSSSEHVHSIIKIFDEKGIELFKEMPIRGEIEFMHAIHPDGSTLEPDPIAGKQRMTGLTTGSIIDYAYRIDNYDPVKHSFSTGPWPLLDMARRTDGDTLVLPIQRMRLIFIIDKELKLLPLIQKNFKGYNITMSEQDSGDNSARVFMWEGKDIPRYEPESRMPIPKEWVPYVEVRGSKFRTWAETGELLADESLGNHRISALVQEAADEITEKVTGDTARTKAFFTFVHEKIKISSDYGEQDAHYTLLTQTGSRIQLFLALLHAADIPYDFVYVSFDPRLTMPPEWDWPQESFFIGGIVFRIRPKGEKEHYIAFQPGTDFFPYGKIPNALQGGYVYSENPGPDMERLPRDRLFDRAVQITETTILLNSMIVKGKMVRPNSDAYAGKHQVMEIEDTMKRFYIQGQLNRVYPGVTLTGFDFPGIDNVNVPFTITATGNLHPSYVTRRGRDKLFCPMGFSPWKESRRINLRSERKFNLNLRFEQIMSDTVVIYPPDGFGMARMPETVQLNDGSLTYTLKFTLQDDGAVRVERILVMPPHVVSVDEYAAFVKFCGEVDEVEQTRLVFEKKQEEPAKPPEKEKKDEEKK